MANPKPFITLEDFGINLPKDLLKIGLTDEVEYLDVLKEQLDKHLLLPEHSYPLMEAYLYEVKKSIRKLEEMRAKPVEWSPYLYEAHDQLEDYKIRLEELLKGPPLMNVPEGAVNEVMMDEIVNGNNMINFHNERKYNRYYKKSSYNKLTKKLNPQTRRPIRPENIKVYKAKIVGKKNAAGGSRNTRKRRSTRKHKLSRT